MEKWSIFCEESGDKTIPWRTGSTNFYIITGVLVREEDEAALRAVINKHTWKTLGLKVPLEWKQLSTKQKKNDALISRFFRKIEEEAPEFLVTTVICNKQETTGPGLVDRNVFMNYLYGLMFKRISWFLEKTSSRANLTIDRNTDKLAQESLRSYISDITRYHVGGHPRHSKPKWINPEEHAVLGLSDFISGSTLRAMENYKDSVKTKCKACSVMMGIYSCKESNFGYYRSFKYLHDWNYEELQDWSWKGLLYHPFEYKGKYQHIFNPR